MLSLFCIFFRDRVIKLLCPRPIPGKSLENLYLRPTTSSKNPAHAKAGLVLLFISETTCTDWTVLEESLNSCCQVTTGLLKFISLHSQRRTGEPNNACTVHTRYKTSMCRDLTTHSSCPRGKHCTFAHSQGEIEQ